jgi:hypothetical protein
VKTNSNWLFEERVGWSDYKPLPVEPDWRYRWNGIGSRLDRRLCHAHTAAGRNRAGGPDHIAPVVLFLQHGIMRHMMLDDVGNTVGIPGTAIGPIMYRGSITGPIGNRVGTGRCRLPCPGPRLNFRGTVRDVDRRGERQRTTGLCKLRSALPTERRTGLWEWRMREDWVLRLESNE